MRMTKTLLVISHESYNPGANEGFVTFSTSTIMTCFIDGFTSKTKYESIFYFRIESEHVCWILNVEDEVDSIWVI